MSAPRNSLDAIASEITRCTKCPLHKSRKNAVPGEGNPNAKIMLIGEAPGYWEDVKGKPFVGAAGKFLDTLLAEAGVSRAQIFIGNILKCRPPNNREPAPDEIQACTPFLDRQITAIKPKLIITLGSHSTAYIFAKAGIYIQRHNRNPRKTLQNKRSRLGFTRFPNIPLSSSTLQRQIQTNTHRRFQTA